MKHGHTQPITEIHAILSRDANGNEGIIGVMLNGSPWPMVSGYPKAFEAMKDMARKGLQGMNEDVRVVKFTTKVDLGPL